MTVFGNKTKQLLNVLIEIRKFVMEGISYNNGPNLNKQSAWYFKPKRYLREIVYAKETVHIEKKEEVQARLYFLKSSTKCILSANIEPKPE